MLFGRKKIRYILIIEYLDRIFAKDPSFNKLGAVVVNLDTPTGTNIMKAIHIITI